jgi:hypothetical protein
MKLRRREEPRTSAFEGTPDPQRHCNNASDLVAAGETLKAFTQSYGITHPTIIRTLRKVEVLISAG